MARIPIGLQLYSVRRELDQDALGTIKAVAAVGYTGVEFAGERKHEAKDLRAMLDQCKLECVGWHVPWASVQDDKLEETIAFHKTLGNRRLIVPSVPEKLRTTRADWLKIAGFFNGLAVKLAPHGMVTGYHNHHVEFTPLEGELPWDTFFGNTRKEVIMQLDTGNAARGGGDCVAILKRYPGRAQIVHLKPYSQTAGKEDPRKGFRPLFGDDELPWNEIFRLCETTAGATWYIVEYECDAYPPLEAVKRCLEKLKAMGK